MANSKSETIPKALQRYTEQAFKDRVRRKECCRCWDRFLRSPKIRDTVAAFARKELGLERAQVAAIKAWPEVQHALLAAVMSQATCGSHKMKVRFSSAKKAGAPTLTVSLVGGDLVKIRLAAPKIV